MSTQSKHDHDHNHNPNFPSTLQAIYHDLQTRHSTATKEILISQDGSHFLAARSRHSSLHNDFDTTHFRTSLGPLLGLDNFNIVQVVGDSGSAFTPCGIAKVKGVIHSLLTSTSVLEYGYTASQHDVNWIVNDLISEDVDLAERTIANVVYESAKAVREWGCEATGKINRFVLAYDEDGETKFGDDVCLSDGVMEGRYGDVIVCVEGGVQAFEQVCGVLGREVGVVVVTGGLREEEEHVVKFSAARLLKNCADAFMAGWDGERIERELLSGLRCRGVFRGKPELYKRIETGLSQVVMMCSDRIRNIKMIDCTE